MSKRVRFHLYRVLAGFYLTLEQILIQFWELIFWGGAFFALWLLQVPQILHRGVEIAAAIIFFIGVGWFAWRGWKRRRPLPRARDMLRRVEQDSAILHRPFSTMDDRLANAESDAARALWQVSRDRRFAAALPRIKRPRPRPVLPQRDPFAFRAFLLLLILIGVTIAGPGWEMRIWRGMIPVLPRFIEVPDETVILWIKAPDYTGVGEVVLRGKGGDKTAPVTVPEGSIIKAHVSGWVGTPHLVMGESVLPMTMLGPGSYTIETPSVETDRIVIRQTILARASWKIAFKPDQPPSVTVRGAIEATPAGKIKIPLSVHDDYSVETLSLKIAYNTDGSAPPPLGTDIIEERSVMSPAGQEMEIAPEFDFSWHPWAGQDVVVTVTVADHKKQTAQTEPIALSLPERTFQHPTAQKLIALRKRLIWTPQAAAENVAVELENILRNPQGYHGDPMVFLALRTALSRLLAGSEAEETAARVVELLWDVALRIEDGNLSLAHRDFMQAQKALQDALRDPNATPEMIAQRMEEMRQAMAGYLREMFREMQKRMAERGGEQPMMTPEMVMNQINPDDLAAFLDRMMAEAMTGNRDTAREMLAEMERFMNMLDPSNMTSEMPEDMQAMMESMELVEEIIRAQQALLEQTQRMAGAEKTPQSYAEPLKPNTELMREWGIEDSLPPQPQETLSPESHPRRDVDSSTESKEQDDIRAKLAEAVHVLGEKNVQIPESFGRADQAMKESSMRLGDNKPGESIPHQEAAIEALTEGQQQTGGQLAKRMQQMMMFSFGAGRGRLDPLGRPMRDGDNGAPWSRSDVKIPDEAERRKVQEILDDLRKKSGELTRPEYELDYFRRLMRQF